MNLKSKAGFWGTGLVLLLLSSLNTAASSEAKASAEIPRIAYAAVVNEDVLVGTRCALDISSLGAERVVYLQTLAVVTFEATENQMQQIEQLGCILALEKLGSATGTGVAGAMN